MRIIAGEFRGRTLLPPESDATRPITDRAKQSLFDILTGRLEEKIVYDCFAGTGSLGLESLSRGSAKALFFESDPSAAARLEKNIATLKLDSRAKIIRTDIFRWFEQTPAPKQPQSQMPHLLSLPRYSGGGSGWGPPNPIDVRPPPQPSPGLPEEGA